MVSTIVALDLGTTHIRGIEADIKNGHPPKIKKIYSLPIESEIISSGEIVNEEGLTRAIKKLWDQAKFKSKYVVAMAGGDAVDTRIQNDVPWSPPEDFKRLLPHYLKDTILLDVDEDYYFDAHTLHEYFKLPEENDTFAMNDATAVRYKTIMVAAVKQRFSDTLVRSIESAGLRPYALDILPMALIRATANSRDIPENASVVSIEIGGDLITIVIHKNLQPIYLDSAPLLGGLRVTSEIAQALGVTLQEAELLKTSFSLAPEQRADLKTTIYGEDGSTNVISYRNFSAIQKEQAAAVVAREVSNLVTHIGDIIEDAFSSTNDAPFRVILSGGGAGLHTLLSRVQSELGIPTVIIQPFENYDGKIEPEILANQHIYASVFGLLVGQNEVK
jgi:cell division ATPase FtsA